MTMWKGIVGRIEVSRVARESSGILDSSLLSSLTALSVYAAVWLWQWRGWRCIGQFGIAIVIVEHSWRKLKLRIYCAFILRNAVFYLFWVIFVGCGLVLCVEFYESVKNYTCVRSIIAFGHDSVHWLFLFCLIILEILY